MRFVVRPVQQKAKGVTWQVGVTFSQVSQVFSDGQNTAVPEGSRKEKYGFPEGKREGVFKLCLRSTHHIIVVTAANDIGASWLE